jgi:hypothetical protein
MLTRNALGRPRRVKLQPSGMTRVARFKSP